MVKAIAFDFWGTLMQQGVKPSPLRQAQQILRVKIPFASFVLLFEQAFMTRSFNDLYEAFSNVCKAFNKTARKQLLDKLVGMWNKNTLLAKPFPDVVQALQDLSKDYDLALITNTDNFSVPSIVQKYDLAKYFKTIIYSFETGFLKANKEIFSLLVEKLGLKPEQVLMVGDTIQSDVNIALQAGLKAVLMDRKNLRDYKPKVTNMQELQEFVKTV